MSPLADGLLNPPVSSSIKVPDLPHYDITQGNPYEHIINFKNKLLIYQDDKLCCKLFLTTFTGEDMY